MGGFTKNPAAVLTLGAFAGALGFWLILKLTGFTIASEQTLRDQQSRIAVLEEENQELSEDLFAAPENRLPILDPADLPYDEEADARAAVEIAQARAIEENKFLMVTFGANWCVDCRTLYKHLESDEVSGYTADKFIFANVNVGKFNRNTDIAEALGINLERGIPVAVFFDPSGKVIGTTNDGELEPARLYTSNQILKFVRDIAERSRILAPDAVM